MTTAILDVKTHEFDVEDLAYLRRGDKPLLARVFRPRGEGLVPGAGRMPRRRLVSERPHHRAPAPSGHGNAWHRVGHARFPLRQRGPLSGLRARHQLCGTLDEAQCARAQDPGRPSGPVGPVERSASRHSRCHAAARSALRGDPLPAGSGAPDATVRCVVMSWPVINPLSRYRLARRVLAGVNPPEWPKSILPRHDAYWRQRDQHGGRQPDAGARTRREGQDNPPGGLVPGPRRRAA